MSLLASPTFLWPKVLGKEVKLYGSCLQNSILNGTHCRLEAASVASDDGGKRSASTELEMREVGSEDEDTWPPKRSVLRTSGSLALEARSKNEFVFINSC